MSGTAGDGLLVGLEIHQQLACPTKLFCACPPLKSEELPFHFERRLRPAQSETGKIDPAAIFEFSKGRYNMYFWSPESSCLVEADEEPPHPISAEALESALLTAKTLGSNVVDEVHVMRKIVIDGSNTGGFQRTAVVGLGGALNVDGSRVGVQSVTVEEDAARILGEDAEARKFALDRLGVALVEVALDPVRGDPEFVGKVALHLGRVLRSTGRVARGLGTIRQDLNVSMMGGSVVEVKGVQKLNLVPRVVEYERRRQLCLIRVAEWLKQKGVRKVKADSRDVTETASRFSSRVLKDKLAAGETVSCIAAAGLAGMLGWEPEPGVRLGKELAEVARANTLGGIIHSDEFSNQGVAEAEEAGLRRLMRCGPEDALVLVAGPRPVVERVVPILMARLQAAAAGVPAETRAATDSGETKYMRPRPGSQRMYPETDIPDIPISSAALLKVEKMVPPDWQSEVRKLEKGFDLSRDLAVKLYDSESLEAFERLAGSVSLVPSFVASALVDLPPRLAREGVPEDALSPRLVEEALRAVDGIGIAKEALPEILRAAASKRLSAERAIESLGLRPVGEEEVRSVVASVVAARRALIAERRGDSFSPLMGEVMRELRGRVDGATVSRLLRQAIADALKGSAGS